MAGMVPAYLTVYLLMESTTSTAPCLGSMDMFRLYCPYHKP